MACMKQHCLTAQTIFKRTENDKNVFKNCRGESIDLLYVYTVHLNLSNAGVVTGSFPLNVQQIYKEKNFI